MSPHEPGYEPADQDRWYPEPPKDPRRGEFSRDRARVVHSSALRRLSAKTQVVGPGSDEFVRNRLTHSLEVAQVGRELALALGCDPDVVDTACLAHDLGHPPFGHNGETALDEISAGIGGFEGNAQTLRLLTRLEPKVMGPQRAHGLNLTRASLDAVAKYPWRSGESPQEGSRKFGAYEDDLDVFAWLREGAPDRHRCIEAQVMDLSDDVAYSVHDVEDAIVSLRFDPARLKHGDETGHIIEVVRSWYLPDVADDVIAEGLDRLRRLPAWVTSFAGDYASLAALKDMTSQLIGRFVRSVEEATRAEAGGKPLTRYHADLVVPVETEVEIAVLKGLAAVYVMTVEDRQPLYSRQRELLMELSQVLEDRAPKALDLQFAVDWNAAPDDAGRLRAVIDQVASLTDARAVTWHHELLPN
ncbi:deoxyguanosinetriphosphate triphosphohydrolase [Kineosporia sp. NBRC 101731]|uniref:deoxyguanosinetriphosphate triphosphohydrolase n=1 Tax=Kineosporia sp. NBRC 101731 TaxID=3032199 RepID=UPI0024A247B4|nr:deoxyguanosinetriphosphate triphosphohydrolase [Kineosporia sp. NBRC 101731]GLY32974.1 deoxyguanosinetriphosphate triphosphohydrolase-like protein [Kineosporia sp. NBRC 101731]